MECGFKSHRPYHFSVDNPQSITHITPMKTIELDVFHSMLANAYAVVVGDTLYYVGYDNEDQPYVADNDGNDRLELSRSGWRHSSS
jgi:hypothetical protein